MNWLMRLRSQLVLVAAVVAFSPQLFAAVGPIISSTQDDNVATGTRINRGDTISNTVQITNASNAITDGTGVTLTIPTPTNATDVVGSVHVSPVAFDESYTAIGNTRLYVGVAVPNGEPAKAVSGNLLSNDILPSGGTVGDAIALAASTTPTAQGGSVSINANGTFVYTPPVNFTGVDTFVYTPANSADAALTGSGTVTITVSSKVWYVNNAGANGDGRSATPFNSLTGAQTASGTNDFIYLFTGNANYTAGITLKNTQTLLGQGVALVVNANLLLGAGSRPTIATIGSTALGLATGNTVSGLNVGATTGRAISGTSVGTLTMDNMSVSARGDRAVSIATGTVTVTLDTILCTNSTDNGINLTNINGTFTVSAGSLQNGAAADLLISGGNGTISFPGDITDNLARCVDIQNRTNGTITLSGNIAHSAGQGINVSGCTGGTVTFSGGSKVLNTGNNSAVTLASNAGATINFINGNLDVDTTAGTAFSVTGGGTVAVNGSGNTINSTSGTAFLVSGGNSPIDINAPIVSTTGRAVDIQSRTGGTITLSANITSAGQAILVQNNTGGTNFFSGASKSLNTGANTAVNLVNNTGSTINFTGGGLDIDTTSGTGFSATGGGTVTVTGSNNTLNDTGVASTHTGTALNIVNTTIAGTGLTFKSITSSGGSGTGIILDGTGNSGGLTINGTGSAGSGGTIANKTGLDGATTTGVGIYLNNCQKVALTNLQLNGFANFAIRGTTVTDFTLASSVTSGVNGDSAGADEGSLIFDTLLGTCVFTSNDIRGGIEDNFRIRNSSGTLTVTISNNTIRDNSTSSSGNDNLIIETHTSANVTANVLNNTFAACNGDHFQSVCDGNATMNLTFTGNFYSGGGGASALLQGITISGGNAGSAEHMTFDISNNGSLGNPLVGCIQGGAINVNEGNGAGIWNGKVVNNFIGNAAVINSGAAQSSCIRVENHSPTGTLTAIVANNTVRQWNNGPAINSQAGDAGVPSLNGKIYLTVTNNVATNPSTNAQHGFVANIGAAGVGTGDSSIAALDIRNNTLDGNTATGGSGIRIRQRENSTVILPGYGGTKYDTVAVGAYITGRNGGSTTANATSSAGPGYINGTVPTPP